MLKCLVTYRPYRRSFSVSLITLMKQTLFSRLWNGAKSQGFEKENLMKEKLKSCFPNAQDVEIVDISGGCGAMYEVTVVSSDFKGLSVVKQHRLVNEALKDEIKDMHGLRIQTSVP